MNEEFWNRLAQTLHVRCKIKDPRHCSLMMPNEEPQWIFVEFSDSGDGLWIWQCQAVVRDFVNDNPDPIELLLLNGEGLLWCYHALNAFEEGGAERLSANLTYTFATPANDYAFALRMLGKVLLNMNKCAVEVTGSL
jgi:hypothetical protein